MPWWHLLTIAAALGVITGGMLVTSPARQSVPSTPRHPAKIQLFHWVEGELARAGWATLNPAAAVMLWVGGALLTGFVVWVLIPIPALPPLAILAVVLAGRALVRARVSARERRLRREWPGVVDHLRSAVRSGASVGEAVVLAGQRAPTDIQPAFESFRAELERGTRLDTALALLKDQVANPIADRIVEALRMAHEVGGRELPRVLESLQSSIRADIAVREDAIAKQSWIRAASRLGVAAPWIVLVVLSGRAETVTAYNSVPGTALILTGALLSVLAYKMMSALGRLPEDTRWLAK